MTFAELEKKSAADLTKLLAEQREELRELRFKLAANQLKQNHKVKETKRLIARIQTRLKQITNQQEA